MPGPHHLRCYEYVDRPYRTVAGALRAHTRELLQQATNAAVTRADEVAANLRVGVVGFELSVAIAIDIRGIEEQEGVAGLSPVTVVRLDWEAARAGTLFPLMSAELSVWPLSSSETQLQIEGDYRPPMGGVGRALDTAVGHRIAEASVHRLLADLVAQLRREIPAKENQR